MEKKEENDGKKNLFVFLLIILFLINGYNFINTDGSHNPLVACLFNMIIFLAIIIFLYHKSEFIKGKKEGQNYLEQYFTKKKKD